MKEEKNLAEIRLPKNIRERACFKTFLGNSVREGPLIRSPEKPPDRTINKIYIEGRNKLKEIIERRKTMKPIINLAAALLTICFWTTSAMAIGTAADLDISNVATASYKVGVTDLVKTSLPAVFTVAEVLDVVVAHQDGTSVSVNPSDTAKTLVMRVTNTGNGPEIFTLAIDNSMVGTDDFNPSATGATTGIFFDTDGNGTYTAGTDVEYIAGTNDPALAADASVIILLVNDIPAGLIDGNTGESKLTATSNTAGPGRAAGDVELGLGEGGTNAVVGTSTGSANDTWDYVVSSVTVSVLKGASVVGGGDPIPGATIRYTITVTVAGAGTALGMVITDPIPANTTYSITTLTLDTGIGAAALTDAADGDVGDVNSPTFDSVTVSLGDLTAASAAQIIIFDVTID